jgi:hypothetical protein
MNASKSCLKQQNYMLLCWKCLDWLRFVFTWLRGFNEKLFSWRTLLLRVDYCHYSSDYAEKHKSATRWIHRLQSNRNTSWLGKPDRGSAVWGVVIHSFGRCFIPSSLCCPQNSIIKFASLSWLHAVVGLIFSTRTPTLCNSAVRGTG